MKKDPIICDFGVIDKFTPGHKCKGKKSQLYHIEIEDDDGVMEVLECDAEINQEDNQRVQILVQAIHGIAAFQTMRLTGHHDKKELQLLLNIGSTHNFIDVSKALKLDCKVKNTQSMWVKVLYDSQLKCNKMIKGSNGECKEWNLRQMFCYCHWEEVI